jgi:hypothetical protein
MTEDIEDIAITPFKGNCYTSGTLKACGYTHSHANIYVKYGEKFVCACVTPADAKKLRDQLIKLFPIEPEETETYKITARTDMKWDVEVTRQERTTIVFATTSNRANAERIVKGLQHV